MRMSRRLGLLKPPVSGATLSFTGTMTYEDSGLYRYYTLSSSGTLTVTGSCTTDIWICGGGGNGGASRNNDGAGGGAGGGYFQQVLASSLSGNYTVTIGSNAGSSSFGSLATAAAGNNGGDATSSAGGAGGNGASGGGAGAFKNGSGYGATGVGGGVSTIPFGDSHFTSKPCAGGTGGTFGNRYTTVYGYLGGSDGSNGTTTASISGAETGGGAIATSSGSASLNATYYGSAGAGGTITRTATYNPGNGYQGVCFLRIPLSELAA